MSEDELTTLFRLELETDVDVLSDQIINKSAEMINGFAHKYKIRLHYLGYSACYDSCLAIERYYIAGENQRLVEEANELLSRLKDINENDS